MTGKTLYMIGVLAAAGIRAAVADTVYVDNKLSDYTGHDGLSWQMAYKTIQEGVDAAADGGTVLVAPGVYGDEQGTRTSSLSGAAITTRVLLPSTKAVTVKSSEGKAKTHIVGRKGTDTAGTGSGAVAGFVIENESGGKGKNSRVEGFTIREVAPSAAPGAYVRGGGVSFLPNTGDRSGIASLPWVVDCVISNASALAGILGNVNCARTWVTDIIVSGNNTSCGYNINAIHSVFTHCMGIAVANCNTIVNCYFADFGTRVTSTAAPNKIYNTIIQFAGERIDAVAGYDYQDNIFDKGTVFSRPASGAMVNTLVKSGSQIVNLPLGDFRPLASHSFMTDEAYKAGAANHGSASWLELFPEEFRHVDFYGKPFTPENGKVHAGASQELVTPKSCLKLQSSVSINGSPKTVRSFECQTYSDVWPVIYRLTPHLGSGEKLVYYQYSTYITDTNVGYVNIKPATKGDSALLVPHPVNVMALFAVKAKKEFWVDRSAAAGGTGTESSPFQTIQQAIDATGSSTSYVHVASGVYDRGEVLYGSTSNRVCLSQGCYRFVATDGPENTVIKGAVDTSEPDSGCGPAAVRCIYAGNIPAVFEGFTLTDGHVSSSDTSTANDATCGAAFYGVGTCPAALVNCIVTNNCSPRNACMYKGSAYRCRFLDNRVTATETAFTYVRMGACLVGRHDVPANNIGFFDGSTYVTHCTVRNYTNKNMVLLSDHSYVFNTIVNHARNNSANANQKRIMGCVFNDFDYNSSINTNGIHYVKKDPLFVDDTEHGDWRLLANSPAFGGGTAWGGLRELGDATAYSTYYALVTHDLAGDEPLFVDGKPTSGAYQRPARIAVPVAPRGSTFSFTGVEDGTVAFDEPVTVTLSGGVREVYGIEVGGVAVDGLSATFMPADVFLAGGALDIRALVSTNWYADAVNGVDDAAHHGRTAEAAKKTLEAAFEYADAGDVVYALPGQYNAGSMIHMNSAYSLWYSSTNATILLPSRVVVPSGVRLVSTDGAERTFIIGEKADSADGVGDGAMRCVTLEKGAYINGFTLTGGGTLDGSTTYQYEVFDNVSGGGVLCLERPLNPGAGLAPIPVTIVANCIISNNCGRGAGGAIFGSYVNCLFTKNKADSHAVREPQWMYGCAVDDNEIGNAAVYQPYYVDFCTFGAGNHNSVGTKRQALYSCPASAFWPVRNSLFLGGERCGLKWAFRCITPYDTFLTINSGNTAQRESLVYGAVAVDEKWRPTTFDSIAVDASLDPLNAEDASFRYEIPDALLSELDISGGQRIYNGAQDVGAGEFDWRSRYREDLGGGSRLTVVSAGQHAVEGGQGVELPDGASLVAAWNLRTGRCEYKVALSGEGTLWLSVNGGDEIAVDASGGDQTLSLPKGENVLAFRYAGDGMATLSDFKNISGFVLSFR